jgi:uncharacterized protein YqgV (UPF0045/DUF77 family)
MDGKEKVLEELKAIMVDCDFDANHDSANEIERAMEFIEQQSTALAAKEKEIERLRGIVDDFIFEVPTSVEYSDWPEVQAIVERAEAALSQKGGE